MEFDIKDKSKRKYTCFVCGVQFTDYEEFSSHIKENHEEGRDYVVCPLKRCGAPVRDIRSHFKVKHPNDKMPKISMNKPIVWKDFSGKKTKTKKPSFREGYYKSNKMNISLHYRSGYECAVYECLDSDNDVLSFNEEPFKISYIFEGKSHDYIPDLVVRYLNGKTEVWEIKPMNQTSLEVNKAKWHAAAKACQTRGWKFVVITEKGIEKLKNKVRSQINN